MRDEETDEEDSIAYRLLPEVIGVEAFRECLDILGRRPVRGYPTGETSFQEGDVSGVAADAEPWSER